MYERTAKIHLREVGSETNVITQGGVARLDNCQVGTVNVSSRWEWQAASTWVLEWINQNFKHTVLSCSYNYIFFKFINMNLF